MRMLCGLVAALLLAGSAGAQRTQVEGSPGHEAAEDKARTVAGGAAKGIRACHDDIEKFCAAVKPGQSRLGKCLKKHSKRLTKPCRAFLTHGGASHVDTAFLELDRSSAPAAASPAKP